MSLKIQLKIKLLKKIEKFRSPKILDLLGIKIFEKFSLDIFWLKIHRFCQKWLFLVFKMSREFWSDFDKFSKSLDLFFRIILIFCSDADEVGFFES